MSADDEHPSISLRKRKIKQKENELNLSPSSPETPKGTSKEPEEEQLSPGTTFWLTRIVFIRSLGFIYCEEIKLLAS